MSPQPAVMCCWWDTKHRWNSLAHSWCRGSFGTSPTCSCTLGLRKPWLLWWVAVLAPSAWAQAQLSLQEQYFVASKTFIAQFWISSGPCCDSALNHTNRAALTDAVEVPKLSVPMCYAFNHQHNCILFLQEWLLSPGLLPPEDLFRHTQTISAETGSKEHKKSSHIST